MKLNEVLDLTTNIKYPEVKLINQYKNINWGKHNKVETRDVIIRDTKTGKVYGRRAISQKVQ